MRRESGTHGCRTRHSIQGLGLVRDGLRGQEFRRHIEGCEGSERRQGIQRSEGFERIQGIGRIENHGEGSDSFRILEALVEEDEREVARSPIKISFRIPWLSSRRETRRQIRDSLARIPRLPSGSPAYLPHRTFFLL